MLPQEDPGAAATMPNFSGNWKIVRSENFEDLLKVLGKESFFF